MSSHMRTSEKVKVMDDFSQVMVNSGHVIEVVQRALMNGMKGHLRKVERCFRDGKEFHRCAASSAQSRKSKKLTQKRNWFKPSHSDEAEDEGGPKSHQKVSPPPTCPKKRGAWDNHQYKN